jgi:hypothetical protein
MENKKKPPQRNATPRKGDKVSGRKGIGNPNNKIDPDLMDKYVTERMMADLKRRGIVLYEDGSFDRGSNMPDEYIDWRKYL